MTCPLTCNVLALIVENYFGRMARVYPEIEAFCLAPIRKSSMYVAVLSPKGRTVDTITTSFPLYGYLIVAVSVGGAE